jgi:uncharacterized protein
MLRTDGDGEANGPGTARLLFQAGLTPDVPVADRSVRCRSPNPHLLRVVDHEDHFGVRLDRGHWPGDPANGNGEVRVQIDACVGALAERLRDVRLFGSYARGDADEDSDVDVLVLVDGLTDLEIGTAAGEAAAVILASGLPLAPLPMSTERFDELRRRERLLARDIDVEGISL